MSAPKNSIFICYRRDDSADSVGRVYDNLALEFGSEAVFRDVDNIPLGVDFRDHIRESLRTCRIGLVIIGPEWTGSGQVTEQTRLDDPADHVRIECETMLKDQKIITIPCFVRGTQAIKASMLPPSLEKLSFINGVQLRRDPDFHNDMRVLKRRLGECLAASAPAAPGCRTR